MADIGIRSEFVFEVDLFPAGHDIDKNIFYRSAHSFLL
jgi:hypothetical protein